VDAEFRTAFDTIGSQVEGVEKRLNDRIDAVHGEFLEFKKGVIGPTDPPSPTSPGSGSHDIASINGVDDAALAVLNGSKPPTIRDRVKVTETEAASLRADVNRILALQIAQSKEQGTEAPFWAYLQSRSGRKLALQVVTAALVLYGYLEARLSHAPPVRPDPAPLPAAASSR
jgi:hypothetical protein